MNHQHFMRDNNEVLVFRTTVAGPKDILKVKPVLDHLVEVSGKWNFDLEDCDRILRVESQRLAPAEVISLLKRVGYDCSELED